MTAELIFHHLRSLNPRIQLLESSPRPNSFFAFRYHFITYGDRYWPNFMSPAFGPTITLIYRLKLYIEPTDQHSSRVPVEFWDCQRNSRRAYVVVLVLQAAQGITQSEAGSTHLTRGDWLRAINLCRVHVSILLQLCGCCKLRHVYSTSGFRAEEEVLDGETRVNLIVREWLSGHLSITFSGSLGFHSGQHVLYL